MTDQTDDARQGFDAVLDKQFERFISRAESEAERAVGWFLAIGQLTADERFWLYIAEEHKAELIEKWFEQRGWNCHCPDASFLSLDNGPSGEITIPLYRIKDDSSTSQ